MNEKIPDIDRPHFSKIPYDYRNMEKAGKYRGVGERGKTGQDLSQSLNAMPKEKKISIMDRDWEYEK